jgi:hypothetical protein
VLYCQRHLLVQISVEYELRLAADLPPSPRVQ